MNTVNNIIVINKIYFTSVDILIKCMYVCIWQHKTKMKLKLFQITYAWNVCAPNLSYTARSISSR